jgi:hypothetical protein
MIGILCGNTFNETFCTLLCPVFSCSSPLLYFFPSHITFLVLASPPFLMKNCFICVSTINMLDSVTSSVWCLVCRPAELVTYFYMFSDSVTISPLPTSPDRKFIALDNLFVNPKHQGSSFLIGIFRPN